MLFVLFVCVIYLCAILSFWALAFVGFLLLQMDTFFTLFRFFSPMEIYVWLLVWLIYILQLLTSLHWRSFHILHSDYMFWISLKSIKFVFFIALLYSLLISLLASEDLSYLAVLTVSTLFRCRLSRIFAMTILYQKKLLQKRSMPHNSERYLFTACLWWYKLSVL